MGVVNNSKWVQVGISKSSTILRNQRNTCECKQPGYPKFRSRKFASKSSDRTCTFCSTTTRFLQYLFPGPQKVRRVAGCDKFETPQSVPQNTTFQNGYFENGLKPSKERRLGHFYRPKRCIFPYHGPQKTQEIPSFLHSGQSISVSSVGIWAKNIAEGVYQNSGSGRGSSENAKHKIGSISRRLASSECKEKISTQEQGNYSQSLFSTRFLGKQRKVKSDTYSRHSIHRREVLPRQGHCHANSRKNNQAKKCSSGFIRERSDSKTIFTNARSDGFLPRNYTKCKVTNEANTAPFAALVETSISGPRTPNSQITAFEGASELVVTGSQHSQGQIFVSNPSQQNNCHGCFHSNVGRKSGSSDHTGFLVRKTERTTHKLSGVGGSNLDYKKLPSSVEKSMCSGSIRQHNSDSVYLPSGRDSVASTVLQNLGTLAVGYQEQYHTESSSHSGKIEHPTRPVEQGSNKAHRMDLEQCSFKSNLSYLGETFDRSLCIISQQEDGHLLHLGPSSPSLRCRCFLSNMESNVCVCVPANLPDSQSFGTHEARTMSGHSDSAAMAKKTLVSGSTKIVHCKSNQVTRDSQSLESTKHNNISSGSQSVQSECMAAINRHLSASGFSQEVRNLLSASWRAGTQKDYSGKFKQFSSWCRGKQIDTYSASLTDCAEFLSSLFHKGLQYRTIAGYRSMLSSVLPPVNNIPVGQHPHIVRLIKGIFNSRPPTTKLLPEWELPLVLDLLKRPPFEPLSLAPLKYLTWKSLFLVAITTFRRASDIQALKLGSGNVSVQKRGITFIRQGLSKSDRQNHVNNKIFVPSFSQDSLLDPVRVLKVYLKRTKKFREFGQDQAKFSLFLSVVEPHKPVTSQTISKWIVSLIKLAYKDPKMKVKGHSTRAIGPSWALFNGASVNSILSAADWSRESTFTKFYLRDVNATALS